MSNLHHLHSATPATAAELASTAVHEPIMLRDPLALRQSGAFDEPALALAARRYLKLRRDRERLFDPALFADPAWDLLLDLFVADIEERKVSITSACIAAAVPASTALRWIERLEETGLIRRLPDLEDRRRGFVSLSEPARERIGCWLATMVQGGIAG